MPYLGGEECGQASDAGEEEEMEEEREADPAEGEHPASPEEELNDQVGGGGGELHYCHYCVLYMCMSNPSVAD